MGASQNVCLYMFWGYGYPPPKPQLIWVGSGGREGKLYRVYAPSGYAECCIHPCLYSVWCIHPS